MRDCAFLIILSQILKLATSFEAVISHESALPYFSLWKIQLYLNLHLAQSL